MNDKDLELDALLSAPEPIVVSKPAPVPVAAPAPVLAPPRDVEGKPLPADALSPEQLRIRQLEDQLARKSAKSLETAPDEEIVATSGNQVVIHFLSDRCTALGRQWYRGQQIAFDLDGQAYKDTKDRNGHSWLSDTEDDQITKFGEVRWRRGPWPGKDYADSESAEKEKRRKMAAPTLPRV